MYIGSMELTAKLRQLEDILDRALDAERIDYDMQSVNCVHKELFKINNKISDEIKSATMGKMKCLTKKPPLTAEWRHNNGYLICGTLRIARADFDNDPSQEFKGEVLDWVVDIINAALPIENNKSIYRCTICHINPVDAENGEDTCESCLSKI